MIPSSERIQGKACAPGDFEGEAVVSNQPFGFWQGIDPLTGIVIDQRHDLCGTSLKGKAFSSHTVEDPRGRPAFFSSRCGITVLRQRL